MLKCNCSVSLRPFFISFWTQMETQSLKNFQIFLTHGHITGQKNVDWFVNRYTGVFHFVIRPKDILRCYD